MDIFFQTLINGLLLGGIYTTIALGLSLVFGVTHVINVAQGEFVMLGAYSAYVLSLFFGVDPLIAIIVIFPVFFVGGYVLQKALINRVIEAPPLISLVMLFSIAIIARNTVLYIWGPDFRSVSTNIPESNIVVYDIYIPMVRLIMFVLAIVSVVCLFLFLQRTKTGLAIRAIAQNKDAAKALGIDINKTYAITFAIGTGLTAIGGVLIATIVSIYPTMGIVYTLFAFFIVVLGGMGDLPGTLIGAFLLGIMQAFVTAYIGIRYTYLVVFMVLYVILVFRPQGILGRGIV